MQPDYTEPRGLFLNTLSLGHKAEKLSTRKGRRSFQALNESALQSVSPGYSDTTFFAAKMQTLISKSMPGWMGVCFGTCLLISSTRAPLCLPAGQAPSQEAGSVGMLRLHPLEWESFGSFHLEPCVTPVPPSLGKLHCCRDFALHFSDCRLKSFSFLSSLLHSCPHKRHRQLV